MLFGDVVVRIRSAEGAAWRREWRRRLPARLVVALPVSVAFGLAAAAATAVPGGSGWATWVGALSIGAFVLAAARPGPLASALATLPAVLTVGLLVATPLRTELVLTETALLLCYLVLVDRWEEPGGSPKRRAVLFGPQFLLVAVLALAALVVAGVPIRASAIVAVAGMAAALGAVALAVRAGRFR